MGGSEGILAKDLEGEARAVLGTLVRRGAAIAEAGVPLGVGEGVEEGVEEEGGFCS